MELSESYSTIKRSIVAFVPKYRPLWSKDEKPPKFPPIFGTGFVVKETGLVATNDHVVKTIKRLFRPPGAPKDEWPLYAVLFKSTPEGQLEMPLDVLGAFTIGQFIPHGVYYGPTIPDLAFLKVKAKGLPAVEIDESTCLREGLEVATAGFPMGTDALTAPGWLHQMTPTLQRGIVSAVLPFTCPAPHAVTINVMTHGGASGSPVFLPQTGKVIGILYAGLHDIAETLKQDVYRVPTNISYVIPSHLLAKSLRSIESDPELAPSEDTKSIDELIKSAEIKSALDEKERYQVREIRPPSGVERTVRSVKPVNDEKIQP